MFNKYVYSALLLVKECWYKHTAKILKFNFNWIFPLLNSNPSFFAFSFLIYLTRVLQDCRCVQHLWTGVSSKYLHCDSKTHFDTIHSLLLYTMQRENLFTFFLLLRFLFHQQRLYQVFTLKRFYIDPGCLI